MRMVKMLMKVLLLPVIAVLRFADLISKILLNVGSYILGLVMLFVLGCGIYMITKQQWDQVLLLAIIEVGCAVLFFGPAWIVILLEDVCDRLTGMLHA